MYQCSRSLYCISHRLKLMQATPAAKKRRLGAEPSAQRERINAVNQVPAVSSE